MVEYEIHQLLYGDGILPPQGHRVVFRLFRIGDFSKYWDEMAKKSIGGPKWKYQSYAIRTTYATGVSPGIGGSIGEKFTDLRDQLGLNERVYIIERCYRPKVGDQIFEFGCEYPDNVEDFITFARSNQSSEKYTFHNVMPVRIDNSKIGYYLCYGKLDQGNN